jgi:hypothetical protein
MCVTLGKWRNAHEHQLGCGLEDVVCGVQVALRLAGENGWRMLEGSQLDQMLQRKSTVMSGARLLRYLTN